MIARLLFLLTMQTAPSTVAEQPVAPGTNIDVTSDARFRAVELECEVQLNGRLRNCVVLSETPPGQGLGRTALEGARRARVAPRSASDTPDAGDGRPPKIRFTTRFQLQD